MCLRFMCCELPAYTSNTNTQYTCFSNWGIGENSGDKESPQREIETVPYEDIGYLRIFLGCCDAEHDYSQYATKIESLKLGLKTLVCVFMQYILVDMY